MKPIETPLGLAQPLEQPTPDDSGRPVAEW